MIMVVVVSPSWKRTGLIEQFQFSQNVLMYVIDDGEGK